MTEQQHRIPLRESVSRKDVENAAWDNDWLYWQKIQKTEDRPYEQIWILDDDSTNVHYIEDFLIDINYILARGDKADEVIGQARETLDTYDAAEALELLEKAQGPKKVVRAIYIAAIAAPLQVDRKLLDELDRLAKHDDADVRAAVIVACGYIPWSECEQVLKKLQKDDSDDKIRDDAALMLEGRRQASS